MKKENKTGYIPKCPYCGQLEIGEIDFDSQEAADAYIVERCSCEGARTYQYKLKEDKERKANLLSIKNGIEGMSEYCEKRTIDLSDDIKSGLYNSAVLVLDDKIDIATIKYGRLGVKISKSSKGNIIIDFKYSDNAKKEI